MMPDIRSSAVPDCDCLLVSTAANIGGMERAVCALARELTSRRWDVRTTFPATSGSSALLAWCREQGVAAEALPAVLDAAAGHSGQGMLALRDFVRDARPRVVNLHYGDNFISLKDVLAVRLAGGTRCVITVHHPTPWSRENARKRLLTRAAAHLANAVVAVSQATRQVLLDAGVPARKLRLIRSGLRPPAHLPSRAQARARLGLSPDAFVVSALARLEPHKGLADLIEAAVRVPDPQTALQVVIAGEGPERPGLERLAAARLGPRAKFLGRVADTGDLYAAADVFALPSYLEGFGLVYLEAAFHGVPSIGTRVGGVPEAVLDEKTGLLVPPGQPSALAAAIRRLRDDPALRRQLGEAAQTRARGAFSDAAMADRYAHVFGLPYLDPDIAA
jgi:glycosyltransferase involved in cell wall biosynthesis